MHLAILGAGAGGAAAAVELTQAGHSVRLWNRTPETLQPFIDAGGIGYEGVLGEGHLRPQAITPLLAEAIGDAQVALVCMPTLAHRAIAGALAGAGAHRLPVVLNPGHTGGALEFATAYAAASGGPVPPVAELSTLTYVCRKYAPARVTVTGRARRLRVAALPGGAAAAAAAQALFAAAEPARDVLETGLANVNMVLHAPGAILGAAWIESTRGDYTFYVQGMTPGVARVMHALDAERLAVAQAFGHRLPDVVGEMQRIGTLAADLEGGAQAEGSSSQDMTAAGRLAAAIASGAANRRIRAPDTLGHRYFREDLGFGLVPFIELAAIAGVTVPTAAALLTIGGTLTGSDLCREGRTARAMGIEGLDAAGLLRRVRG
jgi:opine dehydrogenase